MQNERSVIWLLALVFAICAIGATAVQAETIGWWRFEEGTAGTNPSNAAGAILDVSGEGNHGTAAVPTELTYRSDVPGSEIDYGVTTYASNSLSMDFSGSYTIAPVTVADADSLDLTTALTIEAFIKPDGVTANYQTIVCKWGGEGNRSYIFRLKDDDLEFVWDSAGAVKRATYSDIVANDSAWHHVAVTLDTDNDIAKLYVDDQVHTVSVTTGGILVSTPGITLGSHDEGSNRFVGLVDEIRISNTVLSADQMLAAVPEPSTWALLGMLGLAASMVAVRRRR